MGAKKKSSRVSIMGNEKLFLSILTTGGTIEKIYDEFEGSLQNRETVVKNKILQKLRLPWTEISVKQIMSKDSLYMDDKDRELILESIRTHEIKGYPIVVLHGTDTLDQSSKYCLENHPHIKVPVVFTGAMKPLGFDDSDAAQNVIEAILAARLMKPGYYVTFHGKLFTVPHFRKNKNLGTFEEI